jgi:hypothetical protein
MASLGGPKNTGAGFSGQSLIAANTRVRALAARVRSKVARPAQARPPPGGAAETFADQRSVELPVHSQPMTPQNGEIATTGASPRSTSTSFASGPPLTV